MSGLTEALTGLLDPADGGPLPQDIADVLWIAGLAGLLDPPPPPEDPAAVHVPARGEPVTGPDRPEPTARPAGPEAPRSAGPPPAEPPRTLPAPTPPPPPVRPPAAPATEARAALHPRPDTPDPVAPDRTEGHVVQVAQPAALAGGLALARALRPLRRPVDAPGRATLDEEATAEATAETGLLLPAWRPAQRPRFSVDLLVDTGATMAVWHRLAGELSTLLERHGAFADVRCWALDTDGPVPRLAPFHRRRPGAPAPARADWSRPLNDPTDRRILLVLTDGIGPAWYGDELRDFLGAVAAVRPTAALQVLPRRLWHRTALRTALVSARASVAGRPVPAFRSDAALPGVPRGAEGDELRSGVRWLPVLEVDADWVTPWADLTAGRTSGWTPMLAAPLTGLPDSHRPQRPTGPAVDPATPARRVARFRAGSSPAAYRLASHLATAPLSLPVMRLVQRATVPESGPTHLAELFVSGLIAPRGETAADPDEQVYDFRDGVREELLAELTRAESVHVLKDVLAKVSGRVAATFGGTLDFRALATVGAGGGEARLSPRSLPFAEVALTVLAGAGGEHAAVVARLAEAVARADEESGPEPRPDPPPLRPESLDPIRPVLSPPEPPRMIGRRRELAALAAAFAPDRPVSGPPEQPAVVVVVGEAGMGRRRLVQEYAGAYGGRHSFTHWIDARRPASLEDGMRRLWAAVGPGTEPLGRYSRLWEQLARHRDWLVVLDGCPSRPPLSLPPIGRGCVLVTTDSSGTWADRGATVIRLGSLRTDEVLDELRARLGPGYDPEDPEQARSLQLLAQRLPKAPDILADVDLDADLAIALPAATDPSPTPASGTHVLVRTRVQDRTVTMHLPYPVPTVPSGMPPAFPWFTGREEELDALLSFLTPVEPGQPPTRATLVTGLPGAGKSELALRAAHLALARGWYPGGALYLDLRERSDASPSAERLGLAVLLSALSVPREIVPSDPRDQVSLFRTVLTAFTDGAGPILLVLDNVPRAVNLARFVPVEGRVTVLVTSRHSLPTLADRFDLGVMSPEDSVQLLVDRVRQARSDDARLADATRARTLADLCDGLPLALAFCAGRLVDDPGLPAPALIEELSDPRHRLDALSRDGRSLRAAFTESYRELSSSEARLFRLLSVYPYPDLSTDVAVGLANPDILVAEQLMAALARAHLLQAVPAQDHWHFPPLLRLYALSLGEASADGDDRANALTRLMVHYQSAAEAANAAGSRYSTVRFRDPDRARAWLDAERPIMIALVRFAAEHGAVDATLDFARFVTYRLVEERRLDDLTTVVEAVRDLRRRRGGESGAVPSPPVGDTSTTEDRIATADLPAELDRLLQPDFAPRRPTGELLLAVHVPSGGEGSHLLTGWILADILRDSTVKGTLSTRPRTVESELLVTVPNPPDLLNTAGRLLLELWNRIERLELAHRPRSPIAVSILSSPPPERRTDFARLRTPLFDRGYPQEDPIEEVTVSRAVLDLLTDRFGAGTGADFRLVPTAAPVHTPDACFRYIGSPRGLGLLLSNQTRGGIGSS
ncbi:SAV_2336 N-terminal domain-related protein [Kitasatospora misakiensis]|uniref:SAV_2336 N-terminal domain-related protein n=1 Tax=Kitasatospora misakiensis TaxID=67330 RepID=A0ABW0WZR0_9ACTN